jgi:hypothetical protein
MVIHNRAFDTLPVVGSSRETLSVCPVRLEGELE